MLKKEYGQGLSSGTPGTFNLQRQKAKTHFVATRLLRHVEPIEAAPHSNNQVNTGMTTQVNTGAVLRSGHLQMGAPRPRAGTCFPSLCHVTKALRGLEPVLWFGAGPEILNAPNTNHRFPRVHFYRNAAFSRFVVFCNCRFKASTCLAISSSSCFATKPAAAT